MANLHHLGTGRLCRCNGFHGCEHTLVEVLTKMNVRLLLLIFEQAFILGKRLGHILLTEESLQDAFLFGRSGAFPIAVEQLFDISIIHNSQFFRIVI